MDFINEITEHIAGPMLAVILALWVLGMFLKRTPSVPDWVIIWALLIVGIVMALFILGFTADAFIQGILVAGVAVLGHQLLKQSCEGHNESKTKYRPEISD